MGDNIAWQINLRVRDELGRVSRHTVYGDTAQEARDKATPIRLASIGPAPRGRSLVVAAAPR